MLDTVSKHPNTRGFTPHVFFPVVHRVFTEYILALCRHPYLYIKFWYQSLLVIMYFVLVSNNSHVVNLCIVLPNAHIIIASSPLCTKRFQNICLQSGDHHLCTYIKLWYQSLPVVMYIVLVSSNSYLVNAYIIIASPPLCSKRFQSICLQSTDDHLCI